MEETTRFCHKCRDIRIVKRPEWLPPNSNAFRCSVCDSKIFVSKSEIAHFSSFEDELNPNSLLGIVRVKQAEYLRNKNANKN